MAPAGQEAATIVILTNILIYGAILIFVFVMALVAMAIYGSPSARDFLARPGTILLGGIAFPVVVLSILLIFGFVLTASNRPRADAASRPLRIDVVGEQWWWRVRYRSGDSEQLVTANEIHIPTNRAVELRLSTADVIHSFWVPRLAGKLDMIPGHARTLTVKATEVGVFRGQCAEYCGGAHALMSFLVIASPPEEFAAWFRNQSAPAQSPRPGREAFGASLFLAKGCGGCHTIRGTSARGVIGPDLTHVGSRRTLAAGILPNTHRALVRWIPDNQKIKPENRMLPYEGLEADEIEALASYLGGLK